MYKLTSKGQHAVDERLASKGPERAILDYLSECGETEVDELLGEIRLDLEKGERVLNRLVAAGYISEE